MPWRLLFSLHPQFPKCSFMIERSQALRLQICETYTNHFFCRPPWHLWCISFCLKYLFDHMCKRAHFCIPHSVSTQELCLRLPYLFHNIFSSKAAWKMFFSRLEVQIPAYISWNFVQYKWEALRGKRIWLRKKTWSTFPHPPIFSRISPGFDSGSCLFLEKFFWLHFLEKRYVLFISTLKILT